jgi:PRTRC genetic system protein A
MFQVYTKTANTTPPDEDIYGIIASNGNFIHTKTKFIEAIVPIKGFSWLEFQQKKAKIFLPKIPVDLMAITLNFFEAVYEEFHSEAVVLIHYNETDKTYMIEAPVQKVSGAAVDYESANRFDGYQLVGTIHNHSNFGAFHSGQDDADERHFNGIHLTTGNILDQYPTISASVVVNGTRFTLTPQQIIENVVQVKTPVTTSVLALETLSKKAKKKFYKAINYYQNQNKDKKFRLTLPEGETLADYPFDPEWMDNVEREKIVAKTCHRRNLSINKNQKQIGYKANWEDQKEDLKGEADEYNDPYSGYYQY